MSQLLTPFLLIATTRRIAMSSIKMMKPITRTQLLYMTQKGNFELECSSTVVGCSLVDSQEQGGPCTKRRFEIQLDRTVMYPQGGGQPSDIGIITRNSGTSVVNIEKVKMDKVSGIVTHFGFLLQSAEEKEEKQEQGLCFDIGDQVHVKVDRAHRQLISECHSAGHVVDSAMARCNRAVPASKAYHFLDSPYAEFPVNIPPQERAAFLQELQTVFCELVEENQPTVIENLTVEEANKKCNTLQNVCFDLGHRGETIRVVTIAGWTVPCGGTHVKCTGELKGRHWGVTGIQTKKGKLRVKYGPTKIDPPLDGDKGQLT